jgi:hypothetical protein
MSSRFPKHVSDILEKLDLREPEPGRRLREGAIYNGAKASGITPGMLQFFLGELRIAGLI